jgi:membrane protein implicated in regulation of membrane protease activity
MNPFHRYLLFQVPGWLTVAAVMGFLHVTAGVSAGLGITVLAVVVALDFVLYPFFRHSYASRAMTGVETLIGRHGRVLKALAPDGMIRVQAETWKASLLDSTQPAAIGETVEVMAIRGLTLVVRRLSERAP